ncbi:MAG: FAD-binding oxidoreductase [Immundisolibacteraceae bacterium]|nr:FAD-binding oxidoreductase [Immundisolibacteraceae bacterium]
MPLSSAGSTDFLQTLRHQVGDKHVISDKLAMAEWMVEPRNLFTGEALAVVRPATTSEVVAVVKSCANAGVSIVPQGGNSGLCGGGTPIPGNHSILLSLSRLNRIRQVNPANNSLIAEAGCIIANLQQQAEQADRLFPLSFAADGTAQIGGAIGTNAGGTNVLRYGNTRDLVRGLEVVLPNGDLLDDLSGLRKDNTGYDLKNLFIGAEGTLGVVTAANLKLFAPPAQRHTAWVAINDLANGIELLADLQLRSDGAVSGCELLSATSLEFVLRHRPDCRTPLATIHPWYLLLELTASNHYEATGQLLENCLADFLQQEKIEDALIAQSLTQGKDFWRIREAIPEAQKLEGGSIKHDISLPSENLAAFVTDTLPLLHQRLTDIRPCIFGHLGDGNLHFNLSQPTAMDQAEFIGQWERFNRVVHDQVDKFGGSISAEHGIGQLKRQELARYKSPVALNLMRQIKRSIDPHNLMNPGKVLPDDE